MGSSGWTLGLRTSSNIQDVKDWVAALVPVAFRHNAIFGATGREQLTLAYETITRRETTVWNTMWVADRDIRVPYDTVKTGTTITKGQDGATNFFRQKKYLTLGDPVALAGAALVRRGRDLRRATALNLLPTIAQMRETLGDSVQSL